MTEQRRKAAEEERRFMELAESDPFNPEVQVRVCAAVFQCVFAAEFDRRVVQWEA